ncbi:hypothetical protein KIPB_001596 [Kipferlia bialata]|uniref:Uncharacterized protein n=1 Tax=Kipferlia bialata TaxID=797122 RepID=A0A9K3CQV7_9EUKA|nr:hypothetical protein KIPB_001596 [Kipferlia bialata]|eukprot:g1596.t1
MNVSTLGSTVSAREQSLRDVSAKYERHVAEADKRDAERVSVIERVTHERDRAAQGADRLKQQLHQSEGEREKMRQGIVQDAKRRDGTERQLSNNIDSLQKAKQKLEGKVNQLEPELSKMKKLEKQVMARLNQAEEAVRELKEIRQHLTGERNQLSKDLEETRGALGSLKKQYHLLSQEHEALTAKHNTAAQALARLEKGHASLGKDYAEASQRLSKTEQALASSTETGTRLQTELDASVAQCETLTADLATTRTSLTNTQTQLEDLGGVSEELSSTLTQLYAEEDTSAKHRAEAEALTVSLADMQSQRDDALQLLEAEKTRTSGLVSDNKQLVLKNKKTLTEANASIQKQKAVMTQRAEVIASLKQKHTDTVASFAAKMADIEGRLTETATAYQEACARIEVGEERLRATICRGSMREEDIAETLRSGERVQAELKELLTHVARTKAKKNRQIAEMERKIATSMSHLAQEKAQRLRYESRHNDLLKTMRVLRANIEERGEGVVEIVDLYRACAGCLAVAGGRLSLSCGSRYLQALDADSRLSSLEIISMPPDELKERERGIHQIERLARGASVKSGQSTPVYTAYENESSDDEIVYRSIVVDQDENAPLLGSSGERKARERLARREQLQRYKRRSQVFMILFIVCLIVALVEMPVINNFLL